MRIRVDLECTEGHRQNDVFLEASKKGSIEYPQCSCGEETAQVYDNRENTEGYWVINGANW